MRVVIETKQKVNEVSAIRKQYLWRTRRTVQNDTQYIIIIIIIIIIIAMTMFMVLSS